MEQVMHTFNSKVSENPPKNCMLISKFEVKANLNHQCMPFYHQQLFKEQQTHICNYSAY